MLMTNDYPPIDPSDPRKDACAAIWNERGPNYQASYAMVFAALHGAIAEHYRNGMWRRYTNASIPHSWYYKREAGLQAWSKRETRLWLPYSSSYTFDQFSKQVFLKRIQDDPAGVLADPDLLNFYYVKLTEKGCAGFKADVGRAMSQKAHQTDVATRLFCLLYDRHTPPLEFWAYPPTAVMLKHILEEKGLAAQYTEDNLRMLTLRLGLKHSRFTVVRWSHSEGRNILDFDVESARAIGLPTGPEN
jgi:hypothetical protein